MAARSQDAAGREAGPAPQLWRRGTTFRVGQEGSSLALLRWGAAPALHASVRPVQGGISCVYLAFTRRTLCILPLTHQNFVAALQLCSSLLYSALLFLRSCSAARPKEPWRTAFSTISVAQRAPGWEAEGAQAPPQRRGARSDFMHVEEKEDSFTFDPVLQYTFFACAAPCPPHPRPPFRPALRVAMRLHSGVFGKNILYCVEVDEREEI